MSIAYHSETWKKRQESSTPESPHRMSFETEAPDRGESEPEAPEARRERQWEAPDAGEGRANWLEHEFTHGRSQS